MSEEKVKAFLEELTALSKKYGLWLDVEMDNHLVVREAKGATFYEYDHSVEITPDEWRYLTMKEYTGV